MSHWSKKYFGREWREDYDCYAFFVEVQRAIFGVTNELDFVAPDYKDRSEAIEFVDNSLDVKKHWFSVKIPNEGDAVLFGYAGNSFHIGIWANISGQSGVIHCQKGHGVVFMPRKNIIEFGTKTHYLRLIK